MKTHCAFGIGLMIALCLPFAASTAKAKKSAAQLEREARTKAFMEAAQKEHEREAQERLYRQNPEQRYRDFYSEHVVGRYASVDGKPELLTMRISGTVLSVAGQNTLLLSDCWIRHIDKAQTKVVNGEVRGAYNGMVQQDGVVAVETDNAHLYADGDKYYDKDGRRCRRTGRFTYTTVLGAQSTVPLYTVTPAMTYEEFREFLRAGHKFKRSSDWEIWAQSRNII